jgi:hypothetical protein
MRHSAIYLCLLLLPVIHVRAAEDEKTDRPINDADSVFAIYTQNHGLGTDGRPPGQLIFAAWPDGRLIWSEHQVAGGRPYRTARIPTSKLADTFAKMKLDGLLEDRDLSTTHFGPDSIATVIFVKANERMLMMQSWHELHESNSKMIATEHGVTPLAGKTRMEIFRESAPEYILYRFAWDELRLAATALIPGESKPIDGNLEFRKGGAVWIESPPDPPKQNAGDGEHKEK